jgi:hypothetical protein
VSPPTLHSARRGAALLLLLLLRYRSALLGVPQLSTDELTHALPTWLVSREQNGNVPG